MITPIYLIVTAAVALLVWILLELAWKREIAFPYRVAITAAAAALWPVALVASAVILILTFVFSKSKK